MLIILLQTSDPIINLMPFVLIGLIFYFFMIRPQIKKQKEEVKFRSELKKGDEIVTIGGIHAKILEINKEFGVTTVIIEHDVGVVMDISDHVVVLDYGKKIGDGTPDEVMNNQDVIDAYLGVSH